MKIKGNMKVRVLTLVASVALLGGTALVASGQTGAFFSDTHSGTLTGTLGTILVTPDASTFSFTDLLPGAPQVADVTYTNTGNSPEDVWVVFNNPTALSALNDLGRYGTVHLSSTGAAAVGDVFDSNNLNDNLSSCGFFSQAPGVDAQHPNCWPLTSMVKIASGLTPTSAGTFHFSFMYASKLSTQPPNNNFPWNVYPVSGQVTINSADCAGGIANPCSGLPYQIVATQVGITPGQVGTLP